MLLAIASLLTGISVERKARLDGILRPVSLRDPKDFWKNVPISECGEELIDISELSKTTNRILCQPNYYSRQIKGSINHCLARKGVVDKLCLALNVLPKQYGIVILDGWRPFAVQNELYRMNTSVNRKDKYVAFPSTNHKNPSPHLTGGAIDVMLTDERGLPVEMGSAFDTFADISQTDYFETLAFQKHLSQPEEKYLNNRRLLYNVMASVGFQNNYNEWWHYDYGDQIWGYLSNHDAVYSIVDAEV